MKDEKQKNEKENSGLPTVRFPIFRKLVAIFSNIVLSSIFRKLVTIFSIIVLLSLAGITLAWYILIKRDQVNNANDSNFKVNQRSAAEVEYTLAAIRSSSQMLMETVEQESVHGPETENNRVRQVSDYFFEQNRQVAAFIFTHPGWEGQVWKNDRFFLSKGIDANLADSYFEARMDTLKRAALGETAILNAAPFFETSQSLLAYFFQGMNRTGAGVLFFPKDLEDNFGSGANQSYLINGDDDILIHADSEMVSAGVNVAYVRLTQEIRNDSVSNKHYQHTDEKKDDYFVAFNKLMNTGGAVVITVIQHSKASEAIDKTILRNSLIAIAVLSISFMCIWLYAKTISDPLKSLTAAAKAVEAAFLR